MQYLVLKNKFLIDVSVKMIISILFVKHKAIQKIKPFYKAPHCNRLGLLTRSLKLKQVYAIFAFTLLQYTEYRCGLNVVKAVCIVNNKIYICKHSIKICICTLHELKYSLCQTYTGIMTFSACIAGEKQYFTAMHVERAVNCNLGRQS